MVSAHRDCVRGSSVGNRPTVAFNQRRSASIKLIAANGVRQIRDASFARSSNSRSGGVSTTPYRCKASRRCASVSAIMTYAPEDVGAARMPLASYGEGKEEGDQRRR